MDLKGVLIDFGYTLANIDEEEDLRYRKGLVSILEKYGYDKTFDELSPLLDNAYRSNRAGEAKDMYEFWKFLLDSMGVPDNPSLIQDFEEHRKQNVGKTIKLYKDAILVITYLKKRYKLALVSNCSVGLSDVLKALGLDRFFEYMILSYEVKVEKPDRRIYLEALQKLDLGPEKCVFVADEISDLEGAREVGLKTFLIRQGPNTFHEAKDPNFNPDYQCNHIPEITKFL